MRPHWYSRTHVNFRPFGADHAAYGSLVETPKRAAAHLPAPVGP